jgi:hypothetical protein
MQVVKVHPFKARIPGLHQVLLDRVVDQVERIRFRVPIQLFLFTVRQARQRARLLSMAGRVLISSATPTTTNIPAFTASTQQVSALQLR